MESVSGAFVETEDTKGSQLSPACMRIPLILRKILENCSISELLQLSLVNKQWNYEARFVIKDRGNVIARLDRQKPCEDLAAFASHVRRMNIVPYCGLCIHFDHGEKIEDHEFLRWTQPLASSLDVIRNQLAVKHLTVSFHPYWERHRDCPPFLWMQQILQDHCRVLENVNVHVVHEFEEFNCQNDLHFNFPRLKKLKVLGCCGRYLLRSKIMFIKAMVSRAPNLQELALDSPVTAEESRALLEGSSAVLVVDGEIDPLNHRIRIRSHIISTLRLRRMRLEYCQWDFSMESFNRIVPVVLQTSRTTLEELSLDLVLVPSLMRCGIRLENVTRLKICTDGLLELDDPHHVAAGVSTFLRILLDLDFTQIFPILTEVEISSSRDLYYSFSLDAISQFVDQGNAIRQEPSSDRAVNIKHLKYLDYLEHKRPTMSVPFVASIFPHVESLSIENCNMAPPFGLICEHWVHLKHLVVHTQRVQLQNWDSLLCGLLPEEISQLREQDDEYLNAVNIVPVMPPITWSMKELRSLVLVTTEVVFEHGENDPTFIISKVTPLIAFSRCPNLSVAVRTKSIYENAWSHLKKYISIIVVN